MSNYEQAVQHFKRAIEIRPENANTYAFLGDAYRNLKRFDLAVKEYHKAIELHSDDPSHLFGLGKIYFDQENYPVAITYFEKAIENGYYSNGDGIKQLGTAYHFEGQYDQAEARSLEAVALFEGLDTRWQLGRTHFELGELAAVRSQPTQAKQHYATALTLFEEMGAMPDAERARDALSSHSAEQSPQEW